MASGSEAGSTIRYFGYGSLANPATHRTPVIGHEPALLSGWRRVWVPRPSMPGFPSALLSVERSAGATIAGLLITDHAASLPDLDQREAHYDRHAVHPDDITMKEGRPAGNAFVYAARDTADGRNDLPILQSYLDAVLAGFFGIDGEAGVRAFLDTTRGWDRDIHADRHQPVYPRAVRIGADLASLFDALIAERRNAGH